MAGPAKNNATHKTPDLWQEAYKALEHSEEGKERLPRLNEILRIQLGKPKLKIRSAEGLKELQTMIIKKAQELAAKQASGKMTKAGKAFENMAVIKDIVGQGLSAGGPYTAIPAAALFLAFSLGQIYKSEKSLMFDLAAKVANYMVLYATAALDCTIHPGDDSQMQALKQNLRMNYVGLYKSLLFATAQIAISLYSDWQFVKALLKHYDWEGQIGEMVEIDGWCKDFERKIEKYKPLNDVSNKEEDQKKAMGPGPRNSLHWAVAFALPNDVSRLVASQEYPINALTPQKWTAAHLAARDGHSNILTALLIAPGIDLRIKNKEGSTPLHIAATYGKMTATRHLLHREIRLLNMRDDRGKTAFLIATMKGHVRVLKVLKENGQDFNQTTNKNGWTGLHMAAENGHLETAKFLLESGTKKDTKTKDKGLTAKQIAEEKKLLELVAIL